MNKDSNDIFNRIDHRSGMTVPDGYFDDFAAKMFASLPQRDEIERPSAVILPPPTIWTRIRPYVYLAAMFAGVWCMLKMFVLMSGHADPNANIDSNPILAEAISNDTFINDFVMNDISQWDVMDEMIDDGIEATSLYFDNDSDIEVDFIDPAAIEIND